MLVNKDNKILYELPEKMLEEFIGKEKWEEIVKVMRQKSGEL